MNLPNGTLLHGGTYKIIRQIGSGGFSVTYEAEHVMLQKRVAIKEFFVKDFCNRDETTSHVSVGTQSKAALVDKLKKKFFDEAVAINRLEHPNIVKVSDVFVGNGTVYYVMDYIDGLSLNEMLKQKGKLSEKKAVKYILQVADALKYIHSQNRLHLDIKPGNIMIDNKDNAILIDFGASKQYDEESGENTSTLMGKTLGYAPIEQMGNSVQTFTPATDIYALGATLYKLVTGITPPEATLLASGEELQPISDEISEEVKTAIRKSMQLNKSKRPQSIDDFVHLLKPSHQDSNNKNEETIIDNTEGLGNKNEETIIDTDIAKKEKYSNSQDGNEPIDEMVRNEVNEWADETHKDSDTKTTEDFDDDDDRRKSFIIPGIIAVVVLLILAYSFFVRQGDTPVLNKSQEEKEVRVTTNGDITTYTIGNVSFNMVKVEGGTFMMGADDEDSNAWGDEKPRHQVTLSDYYIGDTEVTQALWKEIMNSNPSYNEGDNLPVERVSWDDCQEFIRKLNTKTGKTFKLPTEAQWEYAARGGNKSRGYKYSGSDIIDAVAWYCDNSKDQTHAVGTKQSNELGLYDMTGNVREWCSDYYDNYLSFSVTNPSGAATGLNRVIRGGGRCYGANECRLSYRDNSMPNSNNFHLGLRLSICDTAGNQDTDFDASVDSVVAYENY